MILQSYLVLLCVAIVLAAQYSVDSSCDNHLAPDSRDRIIEAVQEGIALAETAFKVMTDHASNEKVVEMSKFVLGEANFEANFAQARSTFEAVKNIESAPSSMRPTEAGWTSRRNLQTGRFDVELYCKPTRFVLPDGYIDSPDDQPLFFRNTIWNRKELGTFWPSVRGCYRTDYDLARVDVGTTKALTRISRYQDIATWWPQYRGGQGLPLSSFTTDTVYANQMDICTKYLEILRSNGWPKIDEERVAKVSTEEFRKGLSGNMRAVDGLKCLGTTMLHELTHTDQGGKLLDVESVEGCYEWYCVVRLKRVDNADSITMLGIALKAWSLGFYVDAEGAVHKLTSGQRLR